MTRGWVTICRRRCYYDGLYDDLWDKRALNVHWVHPSHIDATYTGGLLMAIL